MSWSFIQILVGACACECESVSDDCQQSLSVLLLLLRR